MFHPKKKNFVRSSFFLTATSDSTKKQTTPKVKGLCMKGKSSLTFFKKPTISKKRFSVSAYMQENSSVFFQKTSPLSTFYNRSFDKSRLKTLISWSVDRFGENQSIDLVEKLKVLGFTYATKAGISLSIDDLKIPPSKKTIVSNAQQSLAFANQQVSKGHLTSLEYFSKVIETWNKTSENLKEEVLDYFRKTDELNPVFIMAFSGARGNISQVRQLTSMRGLMSNPQGMIIPFPIQSNFREGLTLTEYLISCHGARKGVVDTALRTATSGYLTRRLVDVAHHVMVRGFDCGTRKGLVLKDFQKGTKVLLALKTRLVGRRLAEDVYTKTNQLIATRNQEINVRLSEQLSQHKKAVLVRSPLTCEKGTYVCQCCYGWSLASHRLVSLDEAVGIIAAQSIGEPGTQLTMRTFHTGGVFSGEVSEEIQAPCTGILSFPLSIAGKLVRTTYGQIAFLTKEDSTCMLFKKPLPLLSSAPNSTNVFLSQKQSGSLLDQENTCNDSLTLKLPAYTLIFAKQNQYVEKGQVLGEVTNFLKNETESTDSYQTLYAEFSGQFRLNTYDNQINIAKNVLEFQIDYFQDVMNSTFGSSLTFQDETRLRKKIKNFKKLRNNLFNSKFSGTINEFWMFSGQNQKIFKAANLLVKSGDFIHSKALLYLSRTKKLTCGNEVFSNSALTQISLPLASTMQNFSSHHQRFVFYDFGYHNALQAFNDQEFDHLTFETKHLKFRKGKVFLSQKPSFFSNSQPIKDTSQSFLNFHNYPLVNRQLWNWSSLFTKSPVVSTKTLFKILPGVKASKQLKSFQSQVGFSSLFKTPTMGFSIHEKCFTAFEPLLKNSSTLNREEFDFIVGSSELGNQALQSFLFQNLNVYFFDFYPSYQSDMQKISKAKHLHLLNQGKAGGFLNFFTNNSCQGMVTATKGQKLGAFKNSFYDVVKSEWKNPKAQYVSKNQKFSLKKSLNKHWKLIKVTAVEKTVFWFFQPTANHLFGSWVLKNPTLSSFQHAQNFQSVLLSNTRFFSKQYSTAPKPKLNLMTKTFASLVKGVFKSQLFCQKPRIVNYSSSLHSLHKEKNWLKTGKQTTLLHADLEKGLTYQSRLFWFPGHYQNELLQTLIHRMKKLSNQNLHAFVKAYPFSSQRWMYQSTLNTQKKMVKGQKSVVSHWLMLLNFVPQFLNQYSMLKTDLQTPVYIIKKTDLCLWLMNYQQLQVLNKFPKNLFFSTFSRFLNVILVFDCLLKSATLDSQNQDQKKTITLFLNSSDFLVDHKKTLLILHSHPSFTLFNRKKITKSFAFTSSQVLVQKPKFKINQGVTSFGRFSNFKGLKGITSSQNLITFSKLYQSCGLGFQKSSFSIIQKSCPVWVCSTAFNYYQSWILLNLGSPLLGRFLVKYQAKVKIVKNKGKLCQRSLKKLLLVSDKHLKSQLFASLTSTTSNDPSLLRSLLLSKLVSDLPLVNFNILMKLVEKAGKPSYDSMLKNNTLPCLNFIAFIKKQRFENSLFMRPLFFYPYTFLITQPLPKKLINGEKTFQLSLAFKQRELLITRLMLQFTLKTLQKSTKANIQNYDTRPIASYFPEAWVFSTVNSPKALQKHHSLTLSGQYIVNDISFENYAVFTEFLPVCFQTNLWNVSDHLNFWETLLQTFNYGIFKTPCLTNALKTSFHKKKSFLFSSLIFNPKAICGSTKTKFFQNSTSFFVYTKPLTWLKKPRFFLASQKPGFSLVYQIFFLKFLKKPEKLAFLQVFDFLKGYQILKLTQSFQLLRKPKALVFLFNAKGLQTKKEIKIVKKNQKQVFMKRFSFFKNALVYQALKSKTSLLQALVKSFLPSETQGQKWFIIHPSLLMKKRLLKKQPSQNWSSLVIFKEKTETVNQTQQRYLKTLVFKTTLKFFSTSLHLFEGYQRSLFKSEKLVKKTNQKKIHQYCRLFQFKLVDLPFFSKKAIIPLTPLVNKSMYPSFEQVVTLTHSSQSQTEKRLPQLVTNDFHYNQNPRYQPKILLCEKATSKTGFQNPSIKVGLKKDWVKKKKKNVSPLMQTTLYQKAKLPKKSLEKASNSSRFQVKKGFLQKREKFSFTKCPGVVLLLTQKSTQYLPENSKKIQKTNYALLDQAVLDKKKILPNLSFLEHSLRKHGIFSKNTQIFKHALANGRLKSLSYSEKFAEKKQNPLHFLELHSIPSMHCWWTLFSSKMEQSKTSYKFKLADSLTVASFDSFDKKQFQKPHQKAFKLLTKSSFHPPLIATCPWFFSINAFKYPEKVNNFKTKKLASKNRFVGDYSFFESAQAFFPFQLRFFPKQLTSYDATVQKFFVKNQRLKNFAFTNFTKSKFGPFIKTYDLSTFSCQQVHLVQYHLKIPTLNQTLYNFKPLQAERFDYHVRSTSQQLLKKLKTLTPIQATKNIGAFFESPTFQQPSYLSQGFSSLEGEVFLARKSLPFKLGDVAFFPQKLSETVVLTDLDLMTFKFEKEKLFSSKTKHDVVKPFFFTVSEQLATCKAKVFKNHIGQLMRYGTALNNTVGLNQSGQIFYLQSNQMVLRYAKAFLLPRGARYDLINGDYVKKDSPLLTLKYKSLKTEDIVQGIPKIEQLFEARETLHESFGIKTLLKKKFLTYQKSENQILAVRKSFEFIQRYILDGIQNVYQSQGVNISDKHVEIIVKQMTSKVMVVKPYQSGLLRGDIVSLEQIENLNCELIKTNKEIDTSHSLFKAAVKMIGPLKAHQQWFEEQIFLQQELEAFKLQVQTVSKELGILTEELNNLVADRTESRVWAESLKKTPGRLTKLDRKYQNFSKMDSLLAEIFTVENQMQQLNQIKSEVNSKLFERGLRKKLQVIKREVKKLSRKLTLLTTLDFEKNKLQTLISDKESFFKNSINGDKSFQEEFFKTQEQLILADIKKIACKINPLQGKKKHLKQDNIMQDLRLTLQQQFQDLELQRQNLQQQQVDELEHQSTFRDFKRLLKSLYSKLKKVLKKEDLPMTITADPKKVFQRLEQLKIEIATTIDEQRILSVKLADYNENHLPKNLLRQDELRALRRPIKPVLQKLKRQVQIFKRNIEFHSVRGKLEPKTNLVDLSPPFCHEIQYEPVVLGLTKASLEKDGFLSAASFQETIKVLTKASLFQRGDFLRGLKENVIVGHLIPAGTGSVVHLALPELAPISSYMYQKKFRDIKL